MSAPWSRGVRVWRGTTPWPVDDECRAGSGGGPPANGTTSVPLRPMSCQSGAPDPRNGTTFVPRPARQPAGVSRHGARIGWAGEHPPVRHRQPGAARARPGRARTCGHLPLRTHRAGAPHVGHIRKEVVFDVLRRWLEQPATRSRSSPTSPTSTTRCWSSGRAGRPLVGGGLRERARAARRLRGARLPPARLRAARDRPHPRDGRDDRHPHRARPRLRGRRRLGRRLLRRPVVAGLRRAVEPAHRRHAGRRGRRPPRQARPARLRALEGPQAAASPTPRPGRRRGVAAARAGTSSARRWPRSTSATSSTSTAAASTCASRTTRTSRPSRAPPASSSPGCGCTTRCSPPPARR